ncbi:hypothetical protein [Nocardiopsis chromatogenes]|uniref:hypothetical protein n=1 Tax=Nocardiopsis chromatogenes TaxID=280239 RepID=UPI001267EFB8|nr:hypothetical protein [Nocardiopsis chromatogenes]
MFTAVWARIADVPAGDGVRPRVFGVARRVLADHRRGRTRRGALAARLRAHLRDARAVRPEWRTAGRPTWAGCSTPCPTGTGRCRPWPGGRGWTRAGPAGDVPGDRYAVDVVIDGPEPVYPTVAPGAPGEGGPVPRR